MGIDSPRSGDRPGEGRDRPDFRPDLWSPRGERDIWHPPTRQEIERERLINRGELRYDHRLRDYVPGQPHDWARREDLRDRIAREVELPDRARNLPAAGDVLPRGRFEIDLKKFSGYSMDPGHPQNNGKAGGWRALGYDVDNPQARDEAARELREMCRVLLRPGRIERTREAPPHGTTYRILSGFIGPNGQHASLYMGVLVKDPHAFECNSRLTTVWVQPHTARPDKERG